jgi:hypothetical protein
MKKIILLSLFLLAAIAGRGQAIYDLEVLPMCWTIGEVDSTLYAYWQLSSRDDQAKVLSYLNLLGQKVTVTGGTLKPGYCGQVSAANVVTDIEVLQDSIIVLLNGNGVEIGRDTVGPFAGGGGGASVTASNGLSDADAGANVDVELGGVLTRTTVVDGAASTYPLSFYNVQAFRVSSHTEADSSLVYVFPQDIVLQARQTADLQRLNLSGTTGVTLYNASGDQLSQFTASDSRQIAVTTADLSEGDAVGISAGLDPVPKLVLITDNAGSPAVDAGMVPIAQDSTGWIEFGYPNQGGAPGATYDFPAGDPDASGLPPGEYLPTFTELGARGGTLGWVNKDSLIGKTVYFDNVAALNGATLSVGDIAITKGFYAPGDGGGVTFYVQADSLAGYETDSIAVIPVLGGYAVVDNITTIEAFGGSLNDEESDQPAINKLISFTKAKGKKVFTLTTKEGLLILEDGEGIDLSANFDEINMFGNNTNVNFVNSETGILEDPEFLVAKTNKVLITGFDINAQFSELKNYYSENLLPTGFSDFIQTSGTAIIDGENLHFPGTGFSAATGAVSYPFIAGESYEIRFNADTLQSTTFSTVYTLPQLTNRPNISLGYNQLELKATTTGTAKIYFVNSNASKSYYSNAELYRIDSVAFSKEWNPDITKVSSRKIIEIQTKSTEQKDLGDVVISEVTLRNYPYTAINVSSSNPGIKFNGFVSDNTSAIFCAAAMTITGCETAQVQGGKYYQLRSLGYTGGIKTLGFSNDASALIEPMRVQVSNASFKYTGAYGTSMFFSGATSAVVSNIIIDRAGYYIDENGIEQPYHETDPQYIDPAGGSVVSKVDPVLFNPRCSWIFSDIISSNVNDTTGIFLPSFFFANGAHNTKVSNSYFDGFTLSVESSESPVSGVNGGSVAGLAEFDNCKISPYEGGNLIASPGLRTKFTDCYFFKNTPTDASQIGFSRWRYPGSNFFTNSFPITINTTGTNFENCMFENILVNILTSNSGAKVTRFKNCNFEGSGRIAITRDLVQPYATENLIDISGTKAPVTFVFRSGFGASKNLLSTEGLKINVSNSDIAVLGQSSGYVETFFKHPGLSLNNVRFYEQDTTYNATYQLTEYIETFPQKEEHYRVTGNTSERYESTYKVVDFDSNISLSLDSLIAYQIGRIITVYDSTGNTTDTLSISFGGKEILGYGTSIDITNRPFFNLVFETLGNGVIRLMNFDEGISVKL